MSDAEERIRKVHMLFVTNLDSAITTDSEHDRRTPAFQSQLAKAVLHLGMEQAAQLARQVDATHQLIAKLNEIINPPPPPFVKYPPGWLPPVKHCEKCAAKDQAARATTAEVIRLFKIGTAPQDVAKALNIDETIVVQVIREAL